jgi:hypothetical protein
MIYPGRLTAKRELCFFLDSLTPDSHIPRHNRHPKSCSSFRVAGKHGGAVEKTFYAPMPSEKDNSYQ